MSNNVENISKIAQMLDDAFERKDIDGCLSCFTEDAAIEFMGVKLEGKTNIKRWMNWIQSILSEVKFQARIIMVESDKLFEEYVLIGTTNDGETITSNQSEILEFEDEKIKKLRIYFDRLDFVKCLKGRLAGTIAGYVKKQSEKWLESSRAD